MSTFGPNTGYVDDLYEQYLSDPSSVSAAWREFFEDFRPDAPAATDASPVEPPVPTAAAKERGAPTGATSAEGTVEPLRGVASRIVDNMEASLAVPTATSARTIPVKLLEENRRQLNLYLAAAGRGKLSFTHLIGWALVRALRAHPALNAAFARVGNEPARRQPARINLGIAIDVERRGQRQLVVPCIKGADALTFVAFLAAYEDLVARSRKAKLDVADFAGTTVTLTNPGMIGTTLSVPRLMEGQGAIIGVGSVSYPPEFVGMAPEVVSELGLSKVMTVTSTYDHRIIQGAESGAMLATVERLLLGERGFYDEIFAELGVPHEPARWSVDRDPRLLGRGGDGAGATEKQVEVSLLVRAHRVRGHLVADLDPLGSAPARHADLELSSYGLSVWDLDRRFVVASLAGRRVELPLRDILDALRQTYCGHVGVEFMHIADPDVRRWLQERMEETRNSEALGVDVRRRILNRLNAAEAFERFLHATYVGHKRFSLEGAETLIPMLDGLLTDAVSLGAEDVVIGMAHRGRLNVLANVVGKSLTQIFGEFEGVVDPQSAHGSGDVKYHLGAGGTHRAPDGRSLTVTVASNPSHLEAVDPVVEGMVRALQDLGGDGARERVVPVLIHGDAAFAGQGVVAETLDLSQLSGYRTGGTVHIVVNNRIGFTTGPEAARSSHYATDVAKMVHAPIFHVNGDQPEAALRVVRMALAFRQALQRDVVVDLVCYRRWGHNEADDPSYTNPLLYAKIERHRSVRKLYAEQLMRRGDLDSAGAEAVLGEFRRILDTAHEEVGTAEADPRPRPDRESDLGSAGPAVETGAARAVLERVVEGLGRAPEGFEVHPKLERLLARGRQKFHGRQVDWALAESLAFGSLVLEGTPVRLSGQDSGRGTFSHRHAVLRDPRTGTAFRPLADLAEDQAPFWVHDSPLSEMAVLGFEYGFSVKAPSALVLWEAQFGDFCNGAQIIIDQFIASAEDKWGQRSGLVLLLPHGYEGQGPEHSSARLERFLILCAGGNMRVCQPTTPAQYFHMLRRQVRDAVRKPLVVATPKSLLRHPAVVSPVAELERGAFQELLITPDNPPPESARRLVLCSGKLFYDLQGRRAQGADSDVAVARLEQLYPWPGAEIGAWLHQHGSVRTVVWAQEEPRNMGSWSFVADRLAPLLEPHQQLRYVGRPPSPSPATGSYRQHQAEQAAIVAEALAES